MKKMFLLFGAASCFISTVAKAENESALPSCGTNCTYILTENGVDAKGKTTYSLTVKPIDTSKNATINSYDRCNPCVGTEVGNYAPWRFENVTEVTIQEGITSIGSRAFEDMRTLKSLNLPEGLQTIEHEAFNDSQITSLELPSTLTSIGAFAFGHAPIEKINGIPQGINKIEAHTFHGSKFTDLVIPENVTEIAPNAFGTSQIRNKALIQNLYCEETMVSQCEAALEWRKNNGADIKVIPYQSTSNGQIFYNNKWYDNANDILSGSYAKKRIYTVDEASKVSGKKNSFKIRYK